MARARSTSRSSKASAKADKDKDQNDNGTEIEVEKDGEITTTITATTHLTLPVHSTPLTYDQLNPRSKPTEFFGPIGNTILILFCPAFALFLFYGCNETTGCTPTTSEGWEQAWRLIGDWPSVAGHLWDWQAAGVYLGWYLYCMITWAILPGDWVEGTLLRDGKRKMYKFNSTYTFVLTLGLTLGILLKPDGIQAFTWIYDHWVPLVTASLAMATFQAFWVYAWSFFNKELLALGGNSGVFPYDFWMGRPLNPTIPFWPSFDIKTFNEVRPGLILWPFLNISCACEQYVRYGKVTDSMWLILAFQGIYSVDCFLAEPSILRQMDITTDGFGFMLSFGDLTWLPFTYTLQARYLAFKPHTLGPYWTAGIVALELIGLYIFRVANNEKNDFKAGKNPKNLKFITTEKGSKLITSGWWGRSRHPNYFGDLLMGLAWCLPTGFHTPLTYFYIGYFTVLLVHRQLRDDEACHRKHGKTWDKYCKIVKYRIVPYVY